MDPINEGLPKVVMEDGTVCLMDSDTLWIPAGVPAEQISPTPTDASAPDPSQNLTTVSNADDLANLGAEIPAAQHLSPDHHYQAMSSDHGYQASDLIHHTSCQRPIGHHCYFGQNHDVDLHEIKPETISCLLPVLDQPEVTQGPPNPSSCLAMTQGLPNSISELRPRMTSTNKINRYRKPLPESTPFFEPQPLGAHHLQSKQRISGNRSRPTGTGIGKGVSRSIDNNYFEEKNRTTISKISKPIRDSNFVSAGSEYDVEYLYLTKVVIRKKIQPVPSLSVDQVSRRRKVADDNSGDLMGGKLARVEACDVIDEMELLRAVESLSSVSWDTQDV